MADHEYIAQRRSLRLPAYDYSQPGACFFTICVFRKECLFGQVAEGGMVESQIGKIVVRCWNEIPLHYLNVELDAFALMPNHVHGILWLKEVERKCTDSPNATPAVGARHASPALTATGSEAGPRVGPVSVGTVLGSFKSACTRLVNQVRVTPSALLWQRNYYERVIRHEEELRRIREYIASNPLRWDLDEENPLRQRR